MNGKGYDIYNKSTFEIKNGKGYILEFIDSNTLKFEGEYLNGDKNGKGKEYDLFGNLEFEGEYLNGKRNGKGKEYFFDGKLKFEGNILMERDGQELSMIIIIIIINLK